MSPTKRRCQNPACRELFESRSRNQRTCKSSCRVALFRAEKAQQARTKEQEGEWRRRNAVEINERVIGALRFLYAEERAEAVSDAEFEPVRVCQCNGHHFRVFDQDGDPYCLGCGHPLKGPKDRTWGVNPEIANLMREAWS